MVGHVLEEHRLLFNFKYPCKDVLGVVLRLWLYVRVAVALALPAVVIRGAEGLVEDLEVSPLDEGPLEGRRDRPGHRPKGHRLDVGHPAPFSLASYQALLYVAIPSRHKKSIEAARTVGGDDKGIGKLGQMLEDWP